MMIEGWGVAVDRLISDFTNGTVEWLVAEGEERGDWIVVEGQGSIDHPAYSAVTLGLIHGSDPARDGARPQAWPGRARFRPPARRTFPDRAVAAVHRTARTDRRAGGAVACRRIALNTSKFASDDEAHAIIAATEAETGLPTDDPVRFGSERLWSAVRAGVETLPWV